MSSSYRQPMELSERTIETRDQSNITDEIKWTVDVLHIPATLDTDARTYPPGIISVDVNRMIVADDPEGTAVMLDLRPFWDERAMRKVAKVGLQNTKEEYPNLLGVYTLYITLDGDGKNSHLSKYQDVHGDAFILHRTQHEWLHADLPNDFESDDVCQSILEQFQRLLGDLPLDPDLIWTS